MLTKPGLELSCLDVLSTCANHLFQSRHPVPEHLNSLFLRNRVQNIGHISEEFFFRRPMTFRKLPFESSKQTEVTWTKIW
jgi:hypothetical protein